MRPEARQLRLELAMPPHGENYSRSRGEGYARDSDMAQTPSSTAPAYDRYTWMVCVLEQCLHLNSIYTQWSDGPAQFDLRPSASS